MRTLINGAGGRIGRAVTYETVQAMKDIPTMHNEGGAYLIALNEPRGIDFVVDNYQARDPVHGLYDWKVKKISEGCLTLNGFPVAFTAEKDISKIPFQKLNIEMVLECSGFYGDRKQEDKSVKLTPKDNLGRAFLQYGVQRVIETYPAKTADILIIMGVNYQLYDPSKHSVISNASCTTKSLALPLQVLKDNGINIDALLMVTTHAATVSQKEFKPLSDLLSEGITPPKEELELIYQIMSHSTGAAKATGLVIPSLAGRMSGMSYRVPTLDGSISNLYFVATSNDEITAERINKLMKSAVDNPKYERRLTIHEGEDIATKDIVGKRENSIFVPSKTEVIPLSFVPQNATAALVQIVSGYDNELGSSVDPVLLANYVAQNNS
jgi:glyceraldehyde-3-phosphate dehydrogenase type I